MGLIKAAIVAAGGIMADQWKEFFYCDAIDEDILVVKGKKRTSSRSSNTKGNDNIISNGSGIAVADGQCMIIVEQGRVVELCAVPGEFTYNSSTEPSIFTGNLGDSVKQTFMQMFKRFAYGGDTGKDQRVYYFNIKDIMGNPFGTPNPVPFRIVDKNINLDIDVSVRCNGLYTYKIKNPLLFYTNVCGNVADVYPRSKIDATLKSEFISALQPSFSDISNLEIRPNQIPSHIDELCEAMNKALTEKWLKLRGLEVVSVSFNTLTLPPEDVELIKQAQRTAIMRDPTMAAATLVGAQADAMKAAGENKAGAMTGFMGLGMAQQAGGINAQNLFQMGAQQQAERQAQQAQQAAQQQVAPTANGWRCSCGAENTSKFCMNCGKPKPEVNGWRCSCGAENTSKFCMNCGKPKPEASGWPCTCGTLNQGKFCMNCGKPKPASAPLYRCDKCGWQPADPHNPPKFCPECGDIFDENDVQ